jgi:hypothetical protein
MEKRASWETDSHIAQPYMELNDSLLSSQQRPVGPLPETG